MINVVVSDKTNIITLMNIALDNKLYVNKKWSLYTHLNFFILLYLAGMIKTNRHFTWVKDKIKHTRPCNICSIIYVDEDAVGCLFFNAFSAHVYIKPQYRRKGLAKKLFEETGKVYDLSNKIHIHSSSKAAIALRKSFKDSK